MFSTWYNYQNTVPPTVRWDDPFGWASGDSLANYPGRLRQAIAHQQHGVHQRRKGQAGGGGGRGGNGLLNDRFDWASGDRPSGQERPRQQQRQAQGQ